MSFKKIIGRTIKDVRVERCGIDDILYLDFTDGSSVVIEGHNR